MAHTTMVQVLTLRAIFTMPAGASPEAIREYLTKHTGVVVRWPHPALRTLLRKKLAVPRRDLRKGLRHAPVTFYGLTAAGLRVLQQHTNPEDQPLHARLRAALSGASYHAAVSAANAALAARTQALTRVSSSPGADVPPPAERATRSRYRPLTRREMKAQGLKRWQM